MKVRRAFELDAEQDNTAMAGEGGLLSKLETGNTNRSDRTGRNRKERIGGKGENMQSS